MATTRRKTKSGGALAKMIRTAGDVRPHLTVRLDELDGKLEAWPEPSVRVNQPSVAAHGRLAVAGDDQKAIREVMLETLVEGCVRADTGERLFETTEEVEQFAEVCPGPYLRVSAALGELLEQLASRIQAAKNDWRPTPSSDGDTSSANGSANPSQ